MSTRQREALDIAGLRELLDAYGARVEHMPEAERARVQALIDAEPAAAALVVEAAALDDLLDAAPLAPPSTGLMARVAEIPLRHPRASAASSLPRAWLLRTLAAGALACALGVISGTWLTDDSTSDDGWNDVTSVAFATGLEEEP